MQPHKLIELWHKHVDQLTNPYLADTQMQRISQHVVNGPWLKFNAAYQSVNRTWQLRLKQIYQSDDADNTKSTWQYYIQLIGYHDQGQAAVIYAMADIDKHLYNQLTFELSNKIEDLGQAAIDALLKQ